jgi:HlyD family secretion protein
VPNVGNRLSSGLLARVSFSQTQPDQIVVPLSALPTDREKRPAKPADKPSQQGTLFVVTGEGDQASVSARSVTLGEQIDGKVQILSGLSPGERFVSRSGRPLKDGDAVRLSILSEK